MFGELRKLTGDLQKALERFSIESKLADIAENEIPDAHARLDHVISMTDEAAHRTLDLVEQSGPLAERTSRAAGTLIDMLNAYRAQSTGIQGFEGVARSIDAYVPVVRAIEAFLPAARADSELIRRNLADVLIAQGYQDLTGQIIRSVMKLVAELENSLTELSGSPATWSSTLPWARIPATAPPCLVSPKARSPRARQMWTHCCRVSECKESAWTF